MYDPLYSYIASLPGIRGCVPGLVLYFSGKRFRGRSFQPYSKNRFRLGMLQYVPRDLAATLRSRPHPLYAGVLWVATPLALRWRHVGGDPGKGTTASAIHLGTVDRARVSTRVDPSLRQHRQPGSQRPVPWPQKRPGRRPRRPASRWWVCTGSARSDSGSKGRFGRVETRHANVTGPRPAT